MQDTRAAQCAPVEWPLDHAPVDPRWCLVHATHMTADETRRVAVSGAVAGLCPTTEANLGDGLFPLKAYLAAGGTLGIGSDSQISVSPVEELRWLEYGQRLSTRHRNIAVSGQATVSVRLFERRCSVVRSAAGVDVGEIEGVDPASTVAGPRADLLVLDHDSQRWPGAAWKMRSTRFCSPATRTSCATSWSTAMGRARFRHRDEKRIAARREMAN